MTTATLLVELLTEELPPKALARLGEVFAKQIHIGLSDRNLVAATGAYDWFATPRRLAILVPNVLAVAPDAAHRWAWLMLALSLIAVVYIGLVALVQQDMKKLVAYSSVSHMGYVTLGMFVFSEAGNSGAILQMLAHGLISPGMFLCVGVLYDRMHSRQIADYGGVANTMPRFVALAMIFAFGNFGVPATAGFVGEWTVIIAIVKANLWIGLIGGTSLVLAAAYTLWMVQRVYLGPIANDNVRSLRDINLRETVVLCVLGLSVLWMGVYPKPIMQAMDASVVKLTQHMAQSKLQ